MSVDSTNKTVVPLDEYVKFDYNCSVDQYSFSYNLESFEPLKFGQNVLFDENEFQLNIITDKNNQQAVSGLQDRMSLKVQVTNSSTSDQIISSIIVFVIEYQNL